MSTTKPKEGTYTHPFFKSDTDRGILLKDMMTDNIVTTLSNMGGEMWAIRRRMLVMEQLMAESNGITPEMIEAYVPSEELLENWKGERDRFTSNIYDTLARAAEVPLTTHLDETPPKVDGN